MNSDENIMPPKVQWLEITEDRQDQRLDNFLIATLKGVPKSKIYRIVRKGEVRVNKGRIAVSYRLKIGDVVRIPPLRLSAKAPEMLVHNTLKHNLEHDILFEDEYLLVLNKASGFAVHGGSGLKSGIIEALRVLRPTAKFLELAHRLDKETSGCLLVAKKRSSLKVLHELFRGDGMDKTYLALLVGKWQRKKMVVTAPLLKNIAQSGERKVVVSKAGKRAETMLRRVQRFDNMTLVEAKPKTGRTHQIRVHCAWLGHPIVGDSRYGIPEINQKFKHQGYKRLCLHAHKLTFAHPHTGETLHFQAPIPEVLNQLMEHKTRV